MVYLVGAGPGDPSLITLRALDLLRSAEVVLYDRLADSRHLLETPPGCILVDVGKSAGNHTRTQGEIIELLVEHGRTGGAVVRLKGGDPFMFGRGGEEAEALVEAGIPFEIVPGVSALQAVTAYAGIPVTHRDHASSLGVATGHGAGGKGEDPVRWRELATAVDTVAVFMGIGNLDTITGELIAGGRDPHMPAAVIERGATPRQRTVAATLATIVERAHASGIKPPALFVCGPSVKLADTLAWYHPGPLGGMTVGVTRPHAQSASFADRLRSLGAQPVLMPTIQVRHTLDRDDVASSLDHLDGYDIIAFSSTNGVDAFFEGLAGIGRDARALAGKVLAAIGPATAGALTRFGLIADVEAKTFIAEGLLDALSEHGSIEGRRVLLVRSNIGRDTLRDGLIQAGASVTQASFYATEQAPLRPYVSELVRTGGIDLVTFTSSSTVDGFFTQVAPGEVAESVRFASIGPETTAAIRKYGVEPEIEAEVYTTAGLADVILERYGKD